MSAAVEVMLARSVTELPTADGWAFEPKLDGFRALLTVSPSGKVRIWSRQRKAPTPYFPEIVGRRARCPGVCEPRLGVHR